jgi:hypothetical protein
VRPLIPLTISSNSAGAPPMVSDAASVAGPFRLLSANGTAEATAANALISGTPMSISAAARARPVARTAATPIAAVPVAQMTSPASTPAR